MITEDEVLDYEADVDDEDDIEIIIGSSERLKVNEAVNAPTEYDLSHTDYTDELHKELSDLVTTSINLNTSKTVTVMYYDNMILIPHDYRISDRLSDIFWPKLPNDTHITQTFPNIDKFNELLTNARKYGTSQTHYEDGTPITSTVGFFSVKYTKKIRNSNVFKQTNNVIARNSSNYTESSFRHCNNGHYLFCDFALIIVKDGVVVDHAIDGFQGNIVGAIMMHNPEKIYYNADVDDALDVFLNYRYSRYFKATFGKLQRIKVTNVNDNFNTLPFCTRYDTICAFCNGLKEIKKYVSQLPKQNVTGNRVSFKTNRPVFNRGCNRWGEPVHNARPHYGFKPKKYRKLRYENVLDDPRHFSRRRKREH